MARILGMAAVLFAPASALVISRLGATPVSQQDVIDEKKKLGSMADMLDSLLAANGGALAQSQVAPALKLFEKNLRQVVDGVNGTKNATEAMDKLKAAKAGVSSLVKELTHQQANLMSETAEQCDSLLLGVLLTRQKEPMAKQLEVLKAADFRNLSVSKYLRKHRDETQALYVQAADYLDKHHEGNATRSNSSAGGSAVAMQKMADALDRRVAALERQFEEGENRHNKKLAGFSSQAANATANSKRVYEQAEKKETRSYKKWAAFMKNDIKTMKAAAVAVRNGDMAALEKSRAALTKSMESLKSKNGGFVVLLSFGHKLLERDCPYCAAQCVEACHNRGEAYTSCLTECADAGKGF